MQRVSVNIPFPGFYCSALSEALDWEESSWLENEDPQGGNGPYEYPDREGYWPEELWVFDQMGEMLFDCVDHGAAHLEMARDYLSVMDDKLGALFGFGRMGKVSRYDFKAQRSRNVRVYQETMQLQFEEVISPREYNFTTDRLFATAPLYLMQKLFARSRAEGHQTLAKVIRERFTSRSGFISYYSNDLAEWLEKPLAAWDENELGTLLLAAIEIAGSNPDDLVSEVCQDVTEGLYETLERAIDWTKLNELRREARQVKLSEWIADDPDAARIWASNHPADFSSLCDGDAGIMAFVQTGHIPYRCTKTPDMFAHA